MMKAVNSRFIAAFQHLLIDSEKIFVQHFRKIEGNEWVLHDYFEIGDQLFLHSIQETLCLREIYENVQF
jgi:hypothetical protein